MLLVNGTTDKIRVTTSTTAGIDVHASFMDLTAPSSVTPGRLNTKITTATTTDVVTSPGAGIIRNVKTLHISNVGGVANVVTIEHTDGTNVVQLESVTLNAGERVSYREGVGMRVIDAAGQEKVNAPVNIGQYMTMHLGTTVSNSTVTAAKVAGLDVVCPAGTWVFEYFIIYQAAATTTGLGFSVNHSGTVTRFVYQREETVADTTATATQTFVADQDILTTTGGLMEVQAARAKSTTGGLISAGVDTLNADQYMNIRGVMVVTVSGTLELYHRSEVAAASSVMNGSSLRLTKVA